MQYQFHSDAALFWKALPDYARQEPESIRDALTEKHIAADSRLARFVGIKAYESAGGAVLRDLFDDGNAGWLTDPALLNRLAAEKLDKAAEAMRAEGWKWVDIIPDLDWESMHKFGKAHPVRTPPTKAQQEEIDALTADGNAIIDEHGEDPDDDAVRNRFDEIQERIAALSDGEETWPEPIKASAGVVIGIDRDGDLEFRYGLISPEDKAVAKKAARGKGEDATGNGKKDGAENAALSSALIEELTAHRTAALQALLSGNSKAALLAVVHALALDCLYHTSATSCIRVSGSVTYLDRSAEGIDGSVAAKKLAAATKAATEGMPKQPEKLWAWLKGRDQKTLLAILAVCVAATVDAVERRRGVTDGAPNAEDVGQLAEALKLDMTKYWQPTEKKYFGRVSKGLILQAVEESVGKPAAANLAAMKKDAMAARAAQLLDGKGWLPAILR